MRIASRIEVMKTLAQTKANRQRWLSCEIKLRAVEQSRESACDVGCPSGAHLENRVQPTYSPCPPKPAEPILNPVGPHLGVLAGILLHSQCSFEKIA